eukprot:snap_masked-scaffold_3-processed-gene-6.34-mRNA-1 protein AED:1.00 eAED:1.00 QI:0/-1/0/0/-1/1/1/0/244
MFLLKTQTLYLCFLVVAFLLVTNALYIVILLRPHDVSFEEDVKYPTLEFVRDYFIASWIVLCFTTLLQLALSWLYLGSASSLNPSLSGYFTFRIKLVRLFQILAPIILFTIVYIFRNPFYIAVLMPFLYAILAVYLYRGRKVLIDRLQSVESLEFTRQASLVKECCRKLAFSITIFLFLGFPMGAVFLVDKWPLLFAKMLFPKPGGIQFFLLFWQMVRDFTALLVIKDILLYFDKAIRKRQLVE